MSNARVISIHSPDAFHEALEEAATLLEQGQVVAVPTETVYGLAANAFNAGAVQRIFAVKGRPAHNPVIVHVDGTELARRCAAVWPQLAQNLAARFWPGPLTVVVERSARIPDVVSAGGPTVGLRWPDHSFVQALIRRCGFPLAAPSANRAGQLSPTTAEHVRRHLGDAIPLIIDSGPTRVGIESTVVDATVYPPRVLRPGMISAEAIVRVVNESTEAVAGDDSGAMRTQRESSEPIQTLRSPGLLDKHYSPRAKLVVWAWETDAEFRQHLNQPNLSAAKLHVLAQRDLSNRASLGRVQPMPDRVDEYARVLYRELHRSDELGAEMIVVQAPPRTAEWEPIWDRLRRAAA